MPLSSWCVTQLENDGAECQFQIWKPVVLPEYHDTS